MELPEGTVSITVETETTLNQTEAPAEPSATCDEVTTNPESTVPATKADVISRLEALSELDAEAISSDEIARCKQQFYGLHNEELRRLRSEHEAAGNDPESFTAPSDPEEEKLKQLLTVIKERKARLREEQEAQRQANYERKLQIIRAIADLSTDTDNINRHHQQVKDLQNEFRSTGDVPPQYETAVWKEYQESVERFYDHSKINKELYDYDLKKNLGEKQLLIDEARKLTEEPDVITAFRRLQELHNKWRETGPVPREQRETVWNEFKDLSAVINKRYQAYFEERKAAEQANEVAKTALCETVEAIDIAAITTMAAWDEKTKTVLEAQEQWKKLGFASRKVNNALFSRFRSACDRFFGAKSEFFREFKAARAAKIGAKQALIDEAEALKDSTDWKTTADRLVVLQQQWKETGGIGGHQGDTMWKRFQAACDYFFEQRKKAHGDTRAAENGNLRAKKEIIARLKALEAEDEGMTIEEITEKVRAAQAEWREIGHVPFRDKNRINDQFRAVIDGLYDRYKLRGQRIRMSRFESNVETLSADQTKLMREREKLTRAYEARKQELQTYENNLGFLSSKSKTGDSMLREIERRVESLRADLAELSAKIKMLDGKL